MSNLFIWIWLLEQIRIFIIFLAVISFTGYLVNWLVFSTYENINLDREEQDVLKVKWKKISLKLLWILVPLWIIAIFIPDKTTMLTFWILKNVDVYNSGNPSSVFDPQSILSVIDTAIQKAGELLSRL